LLSFCLFGSVALCSAPKPVAAEEAVRVDNGAVRYVEESIQAVLDREQSNPVERSAAPIPARHLPGYEESKAAANQEPAQQRGAHADDVLLDPAALDVQSLLGDSRRISFQNPGSCNCEPPDPIISVGTNHVLAGINDNLRAFNKLTGTTVWSTSFETFFSSVNPAGAGSFTSDPKLFFDPGSQRYFVTILMINSAQTKSWWMLAVSTTDNITDSTSTWRKWAFDPTVAHANSFADYPGFGFDSNAVYVTSNMFNSSGTAFLGVDLAVFPKAQLLVATPTPTFTQLVNVTTSSGGGAFTIQPAHMYGSGDCFFASASANSGSNIFFYRVNNPLSSPTLTKSSRAVTSYSNPPNAAQSGSATQIDTGDTRLINVFWRDNLLWTAHGINSGGVAAARWYSFDTSGWPSAPTTAQLGNVTSAGTYYYFPSIATDMNGNAAIGFTRSSSTEFASAYHTLRLVSDPPNTMGTPVLDHAGTASYGGTRWGDFSGTTIDPVDNLTFWTMQEYSRSGGPGWSSWITSFLAPSPCTAPTISPISNDSATCGVAYTSPTPSTSAGTAPIAWSLSGSPPAGMTISSTTGVVSWPAPITTGSPFTVSLTATNACGADTKSYQLTVNANPPVISPIADTASVCSVPFMLNASASGGATPYAWSIVGSPPAGLSIDPGTGVLSWANPVVSPTPYSITVRADSASGCGSSTVSFNLTVALGDLNGDGVVNSLDVPLFVNELIGVSAPILCAADLNNDGVVNGEDIQLYIALLP